MKSLIIVINNQNHRYHRRRYHEKRTKISDILLTMQPQDLVGSDNGRYENIEVSLCLEILRAPLLLDYFWRGRGHFQFSELFVGFVVLWYVFFCLLTINSLLILLRAGRDRQKRVGDEEQAKAESLGWVRAERSDNIFSVCLHFIRQFLSLIFLASNKLFSSCRSHGRNHFISLMISLRNFLSKLSMCMKMFQLLTKVRNLSKRMKIKRSCLALSNTISQRSNQGKTFFSFFKKFSYFSSTLKCKVHSLELL